MMTKGCGYDKPQDDFWRLIALKKFQKCRGQTIYMTTSVEL